MRFFTLFFVTFLLCSALFAQTLKPEDIKIKWQLIENNHKGKVENYNLLTFTNQSKQALQPEGWKIFFNFGRIIDPASVTGNVEIKRINGELYEMSPKQGFKPIAKGESIEVNFASSAWLINYTDAPVGFYMLNQKTGKYTNLSAVNIVTSTQEKQFMRSPADKISVITPETIYNNNKKIKVVDHTTLCPILPSPSTYEAGNGVFVLSLKTKIENNANTKIDSYFSNILNNLLDQPAGQTDNKIVFTQSTLVLPESYSLEISNNQVTISASDDAGFFYAVQSLIQLMPTNVFDKKQTSISIQQAKITDMPRFGHRAFHLDISRNFQSKAQVLKVLDLMALYKMNVFHLHFSDDDGWRIEMPSLPELTQIGSRRGPGSDDEMILPTYGSGAEAENAGTGYYTEADFIEILKYAAERHIQVIPEVETPGHARAAIKAMEARYRKYMAAGNKTEAERYRLVHPNDTSKYLSVQMWNDNIMDVSMPSVYTFIERVTDDFVAMYKKAGTPLYTIHMGGDEVPAGVWINSPAFAELRKTRPDLKDADDLWYYYYNKVDKILQQRNLFLSGWEEAGVRFTKLNGNRIMIPNPDFSHRNFQVDVWNNVLGWGAEDLAYKMANSGYKVVLSCVSNNYLDMSYYKSFEEPGYYWGSYIDTDKPFAFIPFDYYKNSETDLNGVAIPKGAFNNKEKLTDYGKSNIVGVKGLLWSETLPTPQAMEYMMLPKLISIAERAWTADPDWAVEPDTVKSKAMYETALNKYFNILGKYHLQRLNTYAGGFNYRIPAPGVLLEGGSAYVNMQLPGFTLRYTTDGKEPNEKSNVYDSPIPFKKGTFKVKAFTNNGRYSRTVTLTK